MGLQLGIGLGKMLVVLCSCSWPVELHTASTVNNTTIVCCVRDRQKVHLDLVQTPQGPLIATVSNYCLLDYKMHFFCWANLRMAAFNRLCIKRGMLLQLLPEKKVLHCTGSNKHMLRENNQSMIALTHSNSDSKVSALRREKDQALEITLCKTCKKIN